MEEEFYRVLNKYQGYGWDELTKQEQDFYSQNYESFKDNKKPYNISSAQIAEWLGEVKATGDTAAYYAAWGQLNEDEKKGYLKTYAGQINAYKKNLVFPSVIRNEDGVIISENKRGLQGDKTPNPKYYTGDDGESYMQNVPELLVTDEPSGPGVYIKEFEDRNPKPDTRNDLGWYTDAMLRDWEDRRNKYVVEGIIKDKPELLSVLDMGRETAVEMINSLSPTAQKFLATDERFQQSYWQDMKDGLYAFGASAYGMNNPLLQRIPQILDDPNKTDYEKEQLVGQYLNYPKLSALGEVFVATEAPANILYRSAKSLVDPELSLTNALSGKRSDMSFEEEFAVDAAYETGMFLTTAGLGSLIKSIPKGLAKIGLNKVKKDTFKPSISIDDWKKWNPEIPDNKELLNEYAEIEKVAKENGTWMKNADGSEFNGPKELFIQSQSENWVKAYGEKGLKPIEKVYRGMPDENPLLINRNDYTGVFSGDKDLAKGYGDNLYELAMKKSDNSVTFNALKDDWLDLNFANRDLNFYKKNIEFNKTHLNKLKEKNGNPDLIKNIEENIKDLEKALVQNTKANENPHFKKMVEYFKGQSNVSTDDVAYYLEKEGLDNIQIKNILDGSFGDINISNQMPGNYLKSLTGNNGMFDMTNPNIYKALVPAAIGTGALQMFNDSYEEQSSRPPSERIGIPPL